MDGSEEALIGELSITPVDLLRVLPEFSPEHVEQMWRRLEGHRALGCSGTGAFQCHGFASVGEAEVGKGRATQAEFACLMQVLLLLISVPLETAIKSSSSTPS